MSEKTTLGKYKYEIVDTAVYMWLANATEDEPPFMYQPHNPNDNIPFATAEEAEQWAIEYINTH